MSAASTFFLTTSWFATVISLMWKLAWKDRSTLMQRGTRTVAIGDLYFPVGQRPGRWRREGRRLRAGRHRLRRRRAGRRVVRGQGVPEQPGGGRLDADDAGARLCGLVPCVRLRQVPGRTRPGRLPDGADDPVHHGDRGGAGGDGQWRRDGHDGGGGEGGPEEGRSWRRRHRPRPGVDPAGPAASRRGLRPGRTPKRSPGAQKEGYRGLSSH